MAQSINFDASGSSGVGGSTSLTPAPGKALQNTSYLGSSDYTFAQQYLPDLYEKEFEKYGNRSVASFLRMVSAEIPCTSDLIKWSEQGRLHIQAEGTITDGDTIAVTGHNFRNNQTIIIKKTDGTGPTLHAIVTDASGADAIDVKCLNLATLVASGGFSATNAVSMFVYGSEFKKGTNGMSGSYEADFVAKENNPIIIKEKYEVSGSEMAHIGWVEVTTENGASGYLWYLKSEHESRLRFEDYLELSMVEGVPAASGSAAASSGFKGTKGLFYEVENNGNVSSGTIDARQDLEDIAKVLDKEGAIQENVIFVNRSTGFDIDKVLAAQNNSGASTSSYGLFDNDEDMALNLGFTGFRIGYDFYKSDWKYLNDATTRGKLGGVDGIIVPAGTMTVYDQVLGQNAQRPFLHVRYRQSASEDRKYKSWVTGSAGSAGMSSDLDAMQVHFLSERALCVMGANNFILMQ
jgi:hypothetical protein|tara:strand:+ start:7131 stop:8519 length:1389 start_codon:yes stop_codon:yes gene_type:complete